MYCSVLKEIQCELTKSSVMRINLDVNTVFIHNVNAYIKIPKLHLSQPIVRNR